MDVPQMEDKGRDASGASDALAVAGAGSGPTLAAISGILIAGIVLAIVAGWVTSTIADRYRGIENVEHGVKYRGTHLSIETATRNSATAYGLLGAVLSLGLGLIAGSLLGPLSIRRSLTAGTTGVVLGAFLGGASAYVLTPIYFANMETADVTLTVFLHVGIWIPIGAAAGIAFGIGSGKGSQLMGSVVGGIAGAGLGSLLFDVCGAFFPFARTERPLSEEPLTRMVAAIVLGLFIVLGIGLVAFQKPSSKTKST